MTTETKSPKRKRSIKKTLLWITGIFFVIMAVAGVLVYNNFNRLLTVALMKSFNSSIVSDVYELKFEKLSVNLLLGNINVYNVELQPRDKPLQNYPYINSSFRLKTHKLILVNAELFTLIKSNILKVDKIKIAEPDVQLVLDGDNHIFFPLKDTTGRVKNNKRPIAFSLKEFKLENASFQVSNNAKLQEFRIKKLDISLNDLLIDQYPGKDLVTYKHIELSIEEFTGKLQKKALRNISFKDFKLSIDSVHIQKSPDTTIFNFADFKTGFKMLDIQTEDSIFHLTMGSFDLSTKEKFIKLGNVAFKPNVSDAMLQRKFVYQKAHFSGSVGTLNLVGIDFESLIHKQKIFIDEITVDKVSVSIFKDKRKPIDKNRFPEYMTQQLKKLSIPLLIKHLKATNVNLVSTEIKPDGNYGKANINRGTVDIKNITSLSTNKMLTLKADAYIENIAHTNLSLSYSYVVPQISFEGTVEKFNLPGLNRLIQSFTPASIKKGTNDIIAFSGNATRTNAAGTMKFLYHDLEIDLQLHDQAKWKSATLAFAANAYLNASNPPSASLPPRIVQFHAERDMNKGFINLLIRSVLSGLKETMIMSKENKKAYRVEKKAAKKEAKAERKAAKKEAKEAKKAAKKEKNKN